MLFTLRKVKFKYESANAYVIQFMSQLLIELEYHEYILQCIEDDNYEELRRLSKLEEDDAEAYQLRQAAHQAYLNTWGYDESKDNQL